MGRDVEAAALIRFLQQTAPHLRERTIEVSAAIRDWLNYVPHTFPNYTRHTLPHSEEIILQVSKLLFLDDDPSRPTVQISPAEAYLLTLAAYLHDAGMVVSDTEKANVLRTTEWQEWTSTGAGAQRHWAIVQLREASEPSDEALRHFLADIQMRFLIAEFVRRSHHTRSRDFIMEHEFSLGRFSFGDPVVTRTVADICASHGLAHYELEDSTRYPDRRDVLQDQVNVRFLAVLLRLGDLLDMSFDRACPLLLNAASPLPSDSLAHWTQYSRITHRLTAPDRIELRAECENQQEHRQLQDWCQWLVDETEHATSLIAHCRRHASWTPPLASLSGDSPTIVIQPAEGTTYSPKRWIFNLDPPTVLDRLITDAYDSPDAFVREVIQNALDAMRCKLYADLGDSGQIPPDYPTQVSPAIRERYPLDVRLAPVDVENPLSGEHEIRQVLTISDPGIGMDEEIIERYFLQVGRSYYTTPEFRSQFKFVPTSRFGVGFLSVFGASDHVVVETARGIGTAPVTGIRLTLTGPRNYLLTETTPPRRPGTVIAITLKDAYEPGQLTRLLRRLCPRVEFPIDVEDLGMVDRLVAEDASAFEADVPDVQTAGASLRVRSFPLAAGKGVEGELYIFSWTDATHSESWDRWRWARYTYAGSHPLAVVPPLPPRLIAFHGMHYWEESFHDGPASWRLDIRDGSLAAPDTRFPMTLRRSHRDPLPLPGDVEGAWVALLRRHLDETAFARGANSWQYRQTLVRDFPFLDKFWNELAGTIPTYESTSLEPTSLSEAAKQPTLAIVSAWTPRLKHEEFLPFRRDVPYENRVAPLRAALNGLDSPVPILLEPDLARLANSHRVDLFSARVPTAARLASDSVLLVEWTTSEDPSPNRSTSSPPLAFLDIGSLDAGIVGIELYECRDAVYPDILLNETHPLIGWFSDLRSGLLTVGKNGTEASAKTVEEILVRAIRYSEESDLQKYLDTWRTSPELAQSAPPRVQFQVAPWGVLWSSPG